MKCRIFLLTITIFALCLSNLYSQDKVRIAVGEWTPYQSKNLKHYGFVNHIISSSFALEGIDVEFGFFPWKRSFDYAKEGVWDGTAVWSRNKEREDNFYISDVIITGEDVFFHLKSYPFKWEIISDLSKISLIGATIGYTYGKEFDDAEKSGLIKVYRAGSDETGFKMLLSGRIMIFPMNIDAGYDLINKTFKADEVKLFTHSSKYINKYEYFLLMSKNNPKNKDLIIKFNSGLKKLKDSGQLEKFISDSRKGLYQRNIIE